MRTIIFAAVCLFCTCLKGAPLEKPLAPPDVIVIELHDGRRVMGEFAGIEFDQRLWLIQREAGIELRSGYEWSRIRRVLINGQPVSPASLRKQETPRTPPWKIPNAGIPLESFPFPSLITAPPLSQPEAMSLEVFAELANWNADAQTDGLQLYVTPRDQFGQPVRAGGELSVVLESRLLGPGPIRQRGDRAPRVELQRWGFSVSPQDFGPEGVMVKLPFQGRRQRNLNGLGVPFTLKVRFGIPGQTVLEAVTAVPIGSPHF